MNISMKIKSYYDTITEDYYWYKVTCFMERDLCKRGMFPIKYPDEPLPELWPAAFDFIHYFLDRLEDITCKIECWGKDHQ